MMCGLHWVHQTVCAYVAMKCPIPPCAAYSLSLDEAMNLRMALGTSIVSSLTSTMSKALTYDSFLSSTCETQHGESGPAHRSPRRPYEWHWPGRWGSRWWGRSGAPTPRRPWSGLLTSPRAAARWADPAALWGRPPATGHLPAYWTSGSVGLWRLAGPP